LRDVIGDFEAGVDRIHLASIDANAAASGNQAFSYIGSNAFTGVCGQLSYVDGIISGDVDGDAAADFEIQVVSAPTLVANDFIL
jgi:serralysin